MKVLTVIVVLGFFAYVALTARANYHVCQAYFPDLEIWDCMASTKLKVVNK